MDFFDIDKDGWQDLLINYWTIIAKRACRIAEPKGKHLKPASPALQNYDGEYNFFWNKAKLTSGELQDTHKPRTKKYYGQTISLFPQSKKPTHQLHLI